MCPNLDVTWDASQPLQVHWITPDTVVLRQSIEADFEAPFLYLLLGRDRALLLDTGATADSPLREVIDFLVGEWLAQHPRAGYGLVIAHSHAHGDHVAGDAQFTDRPNTVVTAHSAALESMDLGARMITVLPIPGHHPSSIAIYDAETGLLLTGDTVYPGRLYVDDFPAFAASISLLCDFADTHPVTAILGAHIEMSMTPGRDFPIGSKRHPHEVALPMTVEQLHAIRDAVGRSARPGAHRFPDFAIWNGPCRRARLSHRIRLLLTLR
jgi:hydroxyacylglutathione hydrolase